MVGTDVTTELLDTVLSWIPIPGSAVRIKSWAKFYNEHVKC